MMFRFFICCLSLVAIGLFVNQAIAGGNNVANGNGVMITETITSTTSSVVTPQENNEMQTLPQDPGVEVAPLDTSSTAQPVMVEEGMMVEETESGE